MFSNNMHVLLIILLVAFLNICKDPKQVDTFKSSKPRYEEVVASEESKQLTENQKYVTIWKAGQVDIGGEELTSVGPENFKALMKLGQGSFGVVYLVLKLLRDPQSGQLTATN